eukprot:GDKI01047185.1.p1 GENE.GDKI01047185.1~~GDKI01047185.1.p1  ORF type:complete len:282 (+),score=61.22 GDKI01047185.1:65-910(+)
MISKAAPKAKVVSPVAKNTAAPKLGITGTSAAAKSTTSSAIKTATASSSTSAAVAKAKAKAKSSASVSPKAKQTAAGKSTTAAAKGGVTAAPKAKAKSGAAVGSGATAVALPLPQPVVPHTPVLGKITLKFLHYTHTFNIEDGVLKYENVDEQFGLSVVYPKGTAYISNEKIDNGEVPSADKCVVQKNSAGNTKGDFTGLHDGGTYCMSMVEPEETSGDEREKKPYVAYKADSNNTGCCANKRMDAITAELKGMSLQELTEKGDRYRELIEARDLEDCLFK